MDVRALIHLLCVALIGAALVSPAAAASPQRCSAAAETIYVYTLEVEAEPDRQTYELGQTVKIHVTVTRPSDEDPLGQGIPIDRPTAEPAPEVSIGVGLRFQGEVFVPGFAMTGEEGKGLVSIRIPEYAKPGTVAASALAEKVVGAETTCLIVKEQGYRYYPEFFTVSKG